MTTESPKQSDEAKAVALLPPVTGSRTTGASVKWEGHDWKGCRDRRVILTLPHPSDEPGTQLGMDSRIARKIGEMLIAAADNADKLEVFEFES